MNNSIAKATLYKLGFMGFERIEARDVEIEFVEHAQYRNAVQVEYTPRGKRKRARFIETDQPTLVVLEDWGHPEFQNYKPPVQSGRLITTELRFAPFSQEWIDAFSAFLDEYLTSSSGKLLEDYRNHVVESEDFAVLEPKTDHDTIDIVPISTEQTVVDESILEGAINQVLNTEYERNSEARRQCLAHYGIRCAVCGFDFEEVYGAIGKGFIHVHHLIPDGYPIK